MITGERKYKKDVAVCYMTRFNHTYKSIISMQLNMECKHIYYLIHYSVWLNFKKAIRYKNIFYT